MAATVADKGGSRTAGSKPAGGRVNRFHQRLGQLTYFQACQLLGDEGGQLIRRGGQRFHDGHMMTVAQITAKKFLTEMDLLRLQKSLLMARMAADSTFLVDKEEPECSSKLERLAELLEGLLESPERKIILFSEWRRMLDRIEHRLEGMNVRYVRLDGKVPQKKRPAIVATNRVDRN